MYVETLAELTDRGRNVIGGKAFGLGRLLEHGFPVPPTVVILARAYDDYVEERIVPTRIYRDYITRRSGTGLRGASKSEERLDEVSRSLQSVFALHSLD